jgi:hypothetical protein
MICIIQINKPNRDIKRTLQQSENNGVFKYIAQHRFADGDFNFVFTKGKRSSRIPEVGIREKQVGGYLALQFNRKGEAAAGESKVFAFISNPQTDLAAFNQLCSKNNLNIYEAYYENCQYAYILELFVKNTAEQALLEQLHLLQVTEAGTYKECMLQAV